ncbi:MAG: hypothetical protein WCB27_16010 [Thermoguttaceae bacterium]
MESWPPFLVFLWRFLLLPVVIAFALALVVVPFLGLGLTVFILATLLTNLIVYTFEEHTRRIKILEEKLDRLLEGPHDTDV